MRNGFISDGGVIHMRRKRLREEDVSENKPEMDFGGEPLCV